MVPLPPDLATEGNIEIPVPRWKVLLFCERLSSVLAARLLVSSFLEWRTNLAVLLWEAI